MAPFSSASSSSLLLAPTTLSDSDSLTVSSQSPLSILLSSPTFSSPPLSTTSSSLLKSSPSLSSSSPSSRPFTKNNCPTKTCTNFNTLEINNKTKNSNEKNSSGDDVCDDLNITTNKGNIKSDFTECQNNKFNQNSIELENKIGNDYKENADLKEYGVLESSCKLNVENANFEKLNNLLDEKEHRESSASDVKINTGFNVDNMDLKNENITRNNEKNNNSDSLGDTINKPINNQNTVVPRGQNENDKTNNRDDNNRDKDEKGKKRSFIECEDIEINNIGNHLKKEEYTIHDSGSVDMFVSKNNINKTPASIDSKVEIIDGKVEQENVEIHFENRSCAQKEFKQEVSIKEDNCTGEDVNKDKTECSDEDVHNDTNMSKTPSSNIMTFSQESKTSTSKIQINSKTNKGSNTTPNLERPTKKHMLLAQLLSKTSDDKTNISTGHHTFGNQPSKHNLISPSYSKSHRTTSKTHLNSPYPCSTRVSSSAQNTCVVAAATTRNSSSIAVVTPIVHMMKQQYNNNNNININNNNCKNNNNSASNNSGFVYNANNSLNNNFKIKDNCEFNSNNNFNHDNYNKAFKKPRLDDNNTNFKPSASLQPFRPNKVFSNNNQTSDPQQAPYLQHVNASDTETFIPKSHLYYSGGSVEKVNDKVVIDNVLTVLPCFKNSSSEDQSTKNINFESTSNSTDNNANFTFYKHNNKNFAFKDESQAYENTTSIENNSINHNIKLNNNHNGNSVNICNININVATDITGNIITRKNKTMNNNNSNSNIPQVIYF